MIVGSMVFAVVEFVLATSLAAGVKGPVALRGQAILVLAPSFWVISQRAPTSMT